jgi:transcriptional regulator with XRE-family HTH domain
MELHAIDSLGPTPEGLLIRRVREMTIPKLSIRNAARRLGMSAEQWGSVERGYNYAGGKGGRSFSPPPATLAKMAHVLEISPERLEAEGQRPDAAKMLREMRPREEAAPASGLPAVSDRPGVSIRIPPGQVVTITLPGLTAIRIDTAARIAAIDGISGTATREEPCEPEWLMHDLRDGTYGDFHRLRPASECFDAECAENGQHAPA